METLKESLSSYLQSEKNVRQRMRHPQCVNGSATEMEAFPPTREGLSPVPQLSQKVLLQYISVKILRQGLQVLTSILHIPGPCFAVKYRERLIYASWLFIIDTRIFTITLWEQQSSSTQRGIPGSFTTLDTFYTLPFTFRIQTLDSGARIYQIKPSMS